MSYKTIVELSDAELDAVTGGTYCNPCECYCHPCGPDDGKDKKNNNGYGNGPESGPAPGNSGSTGGGKNENYGPRGPR